MREVGNRRVMCVEIIAYHWHLQAAAAVGLNRLVYQRRQLAEASGTDHCAATVTSAGGRAIKLSCRCACKDARRWAALTLLGDVTPIDFALAELAKYNARKRVRSAREEREILLHTLPKDGLIDCPLSLVSRISLCVSSPIHFISSVIILPC